MSKSVNITLNSNNAISGSTTTQSSYFINLPLHLDKTKKHMLHWSYMGGKNNYTGTGFNNQIATVYLDFITNSYASNATTVLTSNMIGFLKPIVLVGSTATCYFQSEDNTNLPIYLETCPQNTILNVSILNNGPTPLPFIDDGTGGQACAGTTSTMSTTGLFTFGVVTSGQVFLGSVVTIGTAVGTITAFGTGTGLAGTYQTSYTGTAVGLSTFTATYGVKPAPYILRLRFTELP